MQATDNVVYESSENERKEMKTQMEIINSKLISNNCNVFAISVSLLLAAFVELNKRICFLFFYLKIFHKKKEKFQECFQKFLQQ